MIGSALVIGGTGPTGPGVVAGLLDRGFDVTILHGGHHEAELPAEVRHIHADPHFRDSLSEAVGTSTYDVVVAQYGRLAVTADVLAGRTPRLIAIGGAHGALAPGDDPRWGALGAPMLVTEAEEHLNDESAGSGLAPKMAAAERALFSAHDSGAFAATLLAYPAVYGPRQVAPHDWCIVRRILDGRRQIVIADGGLRLESRLYVDHAVDAVLLTLDHPQRSHGQKFVVTDRHSYSMRQRIDFIAARLGVEVELIDMPYAVATPCHPYWRHGPGHRLRSSEWIRNQLGHEDAHAADEALGRTINWLTENQPTRNGPEEQRIGDPFDYVHEDALIEWWQRQMRCPPAGATVHTPRHAYRHPRTLGDRWTP